MIKIKYLIQGKKSETAKLKNIFHNKDFTILTWDESEQECIYFPESTWTEGRRKLLSTIRIHNYDYVSFIDGDINIVRGCLDAHEAKINKLLPAIATPVFEKNRRFYSNLSPKYKQALIFDTDEQFLTINTKILASHYKLNPFVTRYDNLSWWYPCVGFEAFTTRNLWRSSLIDLEFEVSNEHDKKYPNNFNTKYIHDEIRRFDIKWYFPFTVNEKIKNKNALIRMIYKYCDKLIFKLSFKLFNTIYQSHSKLDSNNVKTMKQSEFFVENFK